MKIVLTVARDITGLAGAALIAYGAWLVMPAAGFVVGGFFLLAGAWLSARRTN